MCSEIVMLEGMGCSLFIFVFCVQMNQNAFQPGGHMPPFPTGAFPPGLPPQTPGGQVVTFPPHIPHPMATAAAAAAAAAAAMSNREGEAKEEQVGVVPLK